MAKKGGSMVKTIKQNLILYSAIVIIVALGVAIAINSIGIDALASLLKGEASGGCPSPNAIANFKASSIVGASFSVNTATNSVNYYFDSLVNRNSVKGVPGLIQYCVYSTTSATTISSITAVAKGANNKKFQTVLKGSTNEKYNYFGFKRDGGDDTNLPLDGKTEILMGSTTWTSAVPANQTILVHINDKAECKALYGNDETCFVYPIIIERQQFGSITVTKYNDVNKNGMQDAGEGALAGWDVLLYDGNGAQLDQGITDINGQVKFVDLTAGNYVVKEIMKPFLPTARWANTDPGSNGPCPQQVCPTPSKTATVTVGVDTQVKFGNVILVAS